MKISGNNKPTVIAVIGSLAVLVILVLGTIWMGQSAKEDNEKAVRTVSLLYLDELAGRREKVVESNLSGRIRDLQTAVDIMDEEDLSDLEHLQAYQSRMKQLFRLEKFAFVDGDGLIYTSTDIQDNIDEYSFDYRTISEPEISVYNIENPEKSAIIAVPVNIGFMDKTFKVCFMQIEMKEMLSGVSMEAQEEAATFCNIYTADGIALSNTILGGLAVEDNLLEAMENAEFEEGYSYDGFLSDFREGKRGVVSFVYNGIHETLSYVPVTGTDWLLTYLIRESVISEKIGAISDGIINRSIIQSILTVAVMLVMFIFILSQLRKNNRLALEKETADAENRVKQEEYEQRIRLQEKLLEEEKLRTRHNHMINALASDYRSVYYLNLDSDTGICYQSHTDLEGDGFKVGERFRYLESVTAYAKKYVTENYLEEFLEFISPESVMNGLKDSRVISFTYVINRRGKEAYEAVKFAKVTSPGEKDDSSVHNVGACFVDVDAETRKNLAQQQALSEALATAKQANKAKSAFLSSMSHEIRTPMNAIIGLDNIALNDPDTPEKTKEYLQKIGSSAEHLLHLINDILDMSRIESGRVVLKNEEFSFSKLIEDINTMFSGQANENGVDYQCHIRGEVGEYYVGDNMKLRQVLINIIGNAVKFTPEGGSVSFDVERKTRFDGKTVMQFVISDTGIGMSEEYLPHIFDTFSQEDASNTSRYGSSGLGMAITKNLVEMMNGSIKAESVKGEGSVFTVTVTLTDSEREEAGNVEVKPEEMSVLIVDDDPVACEHAKLVLEKAGIASETAASGMEAVEKVRLRKARMNPYNLILVDWKMPEMDGVETTRRIRQITGNESAIIILTAYRWDDVLEEALEAGVDSFIPKPLFAAAVIEEFRSALEKKNVLADDNVQKADLDGRMILLAEDVAVNAEIMAMVLEARGMKCDLAANGRIAVEKFTGHEAGYYDAVLMDVRMPEMDGLEAAGLIRSSGKEDARTIPIIALTANAFDEDVQRSLQSGMDAHLSKPVKPEALYETLETLIKS